MTKKLVMAALKDAIRHIQSTEGCILHSDRGSQYCWLDYQALEKSMIYQQHFRTCEEAKSAVFEYVWIFYNRKRIHEANGYLTPEEYYKQHQADLKSPRNQNMGRKVYSIILNG